MVSITSTLSHQEEQDFLSIKKQRELNMSVETFASIAGVRGQQFGKDVYSSMLKFKDLSEFLKVFPNVQRSISNARVGSVKRYVLEGVLSEESAEMKFFSSITVTCRGHMFYDSDKGSIHIDTRSPMSINDGQHRVQGTKQAIEELKQAIAKSNDVDERIKLNKALKTLEEMVIPVVIFNGINESQEKQLFFDLNNLSRRPSKSANIRLSQTDLYAKMAREIADTNKYFIHYGVEYDKQMLGKKDETKTFLLNTIYNSIKVLLNSRIQADKNFLTEDNYDSVKEDVADIFDKILYSLPHDMNKKQQYIICKSYVLSGICKFVAYAQENMMFTDREEIFNTIKKANWSYGKHWIEFGAVTGRFQESKVAFGSTGTGIRGVFTYLKKLSGDK